MYEIILDTLIDSIKLLPFLFFSYLLIEYIEHKASEKLKKALTSSGKYGAFAGSILGAIPQCGFSVTAANLYAGRVISLGTLIAIFLSTSDEAIPVLISNPQSIPKILPIVLIKVLIGMLFGFIIDLILNRKKTDNKESLNENTHMNGLCDKCDCEHGILKSTLHHTINVFVFILVVAFVLNLTISLIGEENLSKVLLNGTIFQPLVAGIIGLIPNCASSVVLTQLYVEGSMSFGSIIAGLSAGSGLGLVVLFKENKNIKQNLKILTLVYLIGVSVGIIFDFIGVVI